MTDNKQRIMEKVRKCFALSESSNPNEAARALAQAQALMKKYDIEASDLDLLDIVRFKLDERSQNAAKIASYEAVLLTSVATAFSCEVIVVYPPVGQRRGQKAGFVFLGRGHHAQIAGYCADVLLRQLRSSMSAHVAALRAEARTEGWTLSRKEGNSARYAYAAAWVQQVHEKVQAFGAAPVDTAVSRALMEATGGRKSGCRKPNISCGDAESWRAGQADGANVDLHRPVNGAETPTRLLADRSE